MSTCSFLQSKKHTDKEDCQRASYCKSYELFPRQEYFIRFAKKCNVIPLLRTNFQGGIFLSKISLEKYSKITNAFMVAGAKFCGHDIPECPCTVEKAPNALIAYCDIKSGVRHDAFAHFYIDDYKFDSIWRYPQRALKKLIRCGGVITPDFSTYQDDPEPFKLYNTYRMRAFGRWLGCLGLRVVNNVRWGTKETWDYCFEGIPKNTIVSIGAVGCIKAKCNWRRFAEGLEEMIRRLTPKIILVYGSAQDKFFGKYREAGIQIIEYPSRTRVVFEKRQRHE